MSTVKHKKLLNVNHAQLRHDPPHDATPVPHHKGDTPPESADKCADEIFHLFILFVLHRTLCDDDSDAFVVTLDLVLDWA